MSDLVERLRSWSEAFPEDIFSPLTDDEKKALPRGTVDRASAMMGRHMASILIEAANELEAAQAKIAAIEKPDPELVEAAAIAEAFKRIPIGEMPEDWKDGRPVLVSRENALRLVFWNEPDKRWYCAVLSEPWFQPTHYYPIPLGEI